MTVDTNKYLDFVTEVTSLPSTDLAALLSRITELDIEQDADVPRLLTAALGLTAESGEFTEVVKKIILQGKPYTEENKFHMKFFQKSKFGVLFFYFGRISRVIQD